MKEKKYLIKVKDCESDKEEYILNYFEYKIKREGYKSHNELSGFINSTSWNPEEISVIGYVFGKYDQELRELYLDNIIKEAKEILKSFEKDTFNDFNNEQVNESFYKYAYRILEEKDSQEIKKLLLVKQSDLFTRNMYTYVNIMDVNNEMPGLATLESAVKKYVPGLNELGKLIK